MKMFALDKQAEAKHTFTDKNTDLAEVKEPE